MGPVGKSNNTRHAQREWLRAYQGEQMKLRRKIQGMMQKRIENTVGGDKQRQVGANPRQSHRGLISQRI